MRGCDLDRRRLPLRNLFGVAAVAMLLAACAGEAQTSAAPVSSAAAASSVPSRPASAPAQPAVSSGLVLLLRQVFAFRHPLRVAGSSGARRRGGRPANERAAYPRFERSFRSNIKLRRTLPAVWCAQEGAPGQSTRHLFARPRRSSRNMAVSAVLPTSSLAPTLTICLKQRKLLMVGTSSNGAPLYTAFEANVRGYTVVITHFQRPRSRATTWPRTLPVPPRAGFRQR